MSWEKAKENAGLAAVFGVAFISQVGVSYYAYKFMEGALSEYSQPARLLLKSVGCVGAYMASGFLVANIGAQINGACGNGRPEIALPNDIDALLVVLGSPIVAIACAIDAINEIPAR